jgi:serine/threonine protein kinase
MIAGKQYFGPLADLWSMGIILFALVCGYLPFEDANTNILYKKILAGDYKTPKWISEEVRDLIAHILETNPAKRYTIEDIRRHPWYRMVSDNDIPKDVITDAENEEYKNETLKVIAEAGLDTQAVMDGVASHACNSLTAIFYLLQQKCRTARAKGMPVSSIKLQLPGGAQNKAKAAAQQTAAGAAPSANNDAQAGRPRGSAAAG